MKELNLLFSAIIFILLFSGCEKKKESENSSSVLFGFVDLYDEFGNALEDKSGVLVSIVDSDPEISAITNATGRYELTNLTIGNYDVKFSKNGFGTYYKYNVKYTNDPDEDIIGIVDLVEISYTTLSGLGITVDYTWYCFRVSGKINPVPLADNLVYVRFFCSESETVGPTNYTSTDVFPFGREVMDDNLGNFNVCIPGFEDLFKDFPDGSKVYVVAYGCPSHSIEYTNKEGITVYPSINPAGSNIANFELPIP
jgi:hypothetical protein